jgi:hypothetical protein
MCAISEVSDYAAFSSSNGLHVCDTLYGTLQASSVFQDEPTSSFCDLKSIKWEDELYLVSASTSVCSSESGEGTFTVKYKILPYAFPTISLLSALGMGTPPSSLTESGPWALLCSLTSKEEFNRTFKKHVIKKTLSIPQNWIGALVRHATSSELYLPATFKYLMGTGSMSASNGLIPRILEIQVITYPIPR